MPHHEEVFFLLLCKLILWHVQWYVQNLKFFLIHSLLNLDAWVDFNFFGHQISAHLKPDELTNTKKNKVDGKSVPVRHFGVVLDWEDWHSLSKKLQGLKIKFIIDPYIRFEGEVGEQATMFFLDPSGNALEFKSFKDSNQLFAA